MLYPSDVGDYIINLVFLWETESRWSTLGYACSDFFHVPGWWKRDGIWVSNWFISSPLTTLLTTFMSCANLRNLRLNPWRKWNPNLLTSWAFFLKANFTNAAEGDLETWWHSTTCPSLVGFVLGDDHPTLYLGGMWKTSFIITIYLISMFTKSQLTPTFS